MKGCPARTAFSFCDILINDILLRADIQKENFCLPKVLFLRWWAIRDSNPGPTGYEPGALTN